MKRLLSSRVHFKKMCKSPVCHLITILTPLVLKETFPMLGNRDFKIQRRDDNENVA